MRTEKVRQNTILQKIEASFPTGIIMRLKELYPGEKIIDAAFFHIHTEIEVEVFYIEYKYYCHLCNPRHKHSEDSIVMKEILYYMMFRVGRFLPVWMNALAGNVQKIIEKN